MRRAFQPANQDSLEPIFMRGLPSRVAFFQVVLTEPRLGKLLPDQPPPHPAGLGPAEHGRAARRPWRPTGRPVRPHHGTTITGHLTVPPPVAINRP